MVSKSFCSLPRLPLLAALLSLRYSSLRVRLPDGGPAQQCGSAMPRSGEDPGRRPPGSRQRNTPPRNISSAEADVDRRRRPRERSVTYRSLHEKYEFAEKALSVFTGDFEWWHFKVAANARRPGAAVGNCITSVQRPRLLPAQDGRGHSTYRIHMTSAGRPPIPALAPGPDPDLNPALARPTLKNCRWTAWPGDACRFHQREAHYLARAEADARRDGHLRFLSSSFENSSEPISRNLLPHLRHMNMVLAFLPRPAARFSPSTSTSRLF